MASYSVCTWCIIERGMRPTRHCLVFQQARVKRLVVQTVPGESLLVVDSGSQ